MNSPVKYKLSLVWQFIKLSLISGIVFMLAAAIALSVLAWIYRDNIRDAFIEEFLSRLKTEAHIGDVGVNFFRSFPMVSVTLNDVVVMEAVDTADKDTLLNARRVFFQFNLMDVIRKKYRVKELEVSLAEFNPVVYKDGSSNFMIWESPDEDADVDADFVFDFEKVLLRRVKFNIQNQKTDLIVSLMANRAEIKGQFKNQDYSLNIKGSAFTDMVSIENIEYISHHDTEIDVKLDVFGNLLFVFKQGGIRISNHDFDLLGEIDLRGDHTFLDLKIEGRKLQIKNLIDDLPDAVNKHFSGYRVDGYMNFVASIAGTFSGVVNPFINAEFGISNAELSDKKQEIKLKNLQFKGRYNNGRFRNLSSSSVVVKDFSTNLNQGFLEGEFSVINFHRPEITLAVNSKTEFSDIINFLKIDEIQEPEGQINLELSYNGSISDGKQLRPVDFISSSTRGNLSFKDLRFKLNNDIKEYQGFSGIVVFNNNDLVVDSFRGSISSSDFNLRGYFRNFLSYLFFNDQKLFIDANFQSDVLNFNELLHYEVSEADTTYRLTFSDRLEFMVTADINNIVFKDFQAVDIKGKAFMRDKVFMAENISLKTMDGNLGLTGTIDGNQQDVLKINCASVFDNIDIQQLFFQMGNFGQDAIADKHLRGKLNSTLTFSANWSSFLEIDWESLKADADLKIDNGELVDFKPILQLSRFLKIGDLEHIKFSTLENQISIRNQVVYIPFMDINSSAIDIKLSGEHAFNNEVDYRLQVQLSDLFAQRSRQNRNPQEQYGEIIDDGESRTLFLLVSGNINDPVFRYDTRASIDRIRQDLRQERKNLREILRDEFSRSPRDTINEFTPKEDKQRIQERKELKKREEGDFIIEWE